MSPPSLVSRVRTTGHPPTRHRMTNEEEDEDEDEDDEDDDDEEDDDEDEEEEVSLPTFPSPRRSFPL